MTVRVSALYLSLQYAQLMAGGFGYQITGKGRWISLELKIPRAKGNKKKQKKGGGGGKGDDYDSDDEVCPLLIIPSLAVQCYRLSFNCSSTCHLLVFVRSY